MTNAPLVSVVVAAFNAERTIAATLTAVLEGHLSDLELVVVDDASNDRTAEVADSIADPRLTVLRQTTNRGPGAARNRGAMIARGDYLTFLDADDLVEPDWLKRLVEPFTSGTGLVGCGYVLEDASALSRKIPPSESQLFALAGTWMVRRRVFEDAGGYDEALRYGENYELAQRLDLVLDVEGMTKSLVDATLLTYVKQRRPLTHAGVEARLLVAETMLGRHGHNLDARRRANYHRIAGVALARLGRRREARREFRLAAAERGYRSPDLLRALVALFPPLAARAWRSPR